ncbi:MAG TPA: hypothetical protein VGJ28_07385 [Micromonosporaceae bacterium]|jgi:hypothetical protein
MTYLIIRTDVRDVAEEIDDSGWIRDERNAPETRRQMAKADSFDAAMRMARALSACGQVRLGRQRVKVIRIG